MTPASRPSVLIPVLAVVIAMASIAAGASIAKGLIRTIGAESTTALRLSLAALMLGVVIRPWRAGPLAKAWRPLLVYGAAMGGMNLCFYMALRTTPLGIATALEFSGPLAVAIAASRRRSDLAWAALAATGLVLLLPIGASSDTDWPGVLFALGAGVCWAIYIVFGKRAGAAYGAAAPALGLTIGAVVVLPFGVGQNATMPAATTWPAAVAVAVLSSALPYTLEMAALRRLPTQTFGILMSCEPAIGALMALIVLGESVSPMQGLAIGLIIAASAGTTRAARRTTRGSDAA